jgi:transcriptional regulator with XRE-family HTH domain
MRQPIPLLVEAERIGRRHGWSRAELYRRLGVSRSAFSLWKRGHRQPSLANWFKLEAAVEQLRRGS